MKHCPFCYSTSIGTQPRFDHNPEHAMKCLDCGATGPRRKTYALARSAWDSRELPTPKGVWKAPPSNGSMPCEWMRLVEVKLSDGTTAVGKAGEFRWSLETKRTKPPVVEWRYPPKAKEVAQ